MFPIPHEKIRLQSFQRSYFAKQQTAFVTFLLNLCGISRWYVWYLWIWTTIWIIYGVHPSISPSDGRMDMSVSPSPHEKMQLQSFQMSTFPWRISFYGLFDKLLGSFALINLVTLKFDSSSFFLPIGPTDGRVGGGSSLMLVTWAMPAVATSFTAIFEKWRARRCCHGKLKSKKYRRKLPLK